MGVGYLFGCLISILLWKLDRHQIFSKIHIKINSKIKSKFLLQFIYILVIVLVSLLLINVSNNELINAIVAFFVIEISNSERRTVIRKNFEKMEFYNTLSLTSKALICGFLAPIIYILIIGNIGGIIYTLVYYISDDGKLDGFNSILNILNIIPTIVCSLVLYIIYIIRNKTSKINFKGDFLINLVTNPLLNIYILAAYIESVNFYYYVEDKGVHYLRSYGIYQGKIDDMCVKDFLTIMYGICFMNYILFWIYIINMGPIIKISVIF
ncbi:MAG: hypothetical protein RR636_05260 [Clostridium sp.]|uniref:hypothetical protein n=1 Tax=Clostridium sp. TaxID=1506 RepID=UPI00303C04CB